MRVGSRAVDIDENELHPVVARAADDGAPERVPATRTLARPSCAVNYLAEVHVPCINVPNSDDDSHGQSNAVETWRRPP